MELHVEIFICLTSFGAFLGPYMGTFDDLNHILVYILFIGSFKAMENCPKRGKNGKNGPKLTNIVINDPWVPIIA